MSRDGAFFFFREFVRCGWPCPAVSRISRMQGWSSMIRCFLYESSIVGSYPSFFFRSSHPDPSEKNIYKKDEKSARFIHTTKKITVKRINQVVLSRFVFSDEFVTTNPWIYSDITEWSKLSFLRLRLPAGRSGRTGQEATNKQRFLDHGRPDWWISQREWELLIGVYIWTTCACIYPRSERSSVLPHLEHHHIVGHFLECCAVDAWMVERGDVCILAMV